MRDKDFDCVQFQREAGQRIYRETEDLSDEEWKEYWEENRRELEETFGEDDPSGESGDED